MCTRAILGLSRSSTETATTKSTSSSVTQPGPLVFGGNAIHVSCDVLMETRKERPSFVIWRRLALPPLATRETVQPSRSRDRSAKAKRPRRVATFSGVMFTFVIDFFLRYDSPEQVSYRSSSKYRQDISKTFQR